MEYRIPTPKIEVFNPSIYYCKRAPGVLTLDGNVDKPFWADAPWTTDFVDIEGAVKPLPRFLTRVKMLWDDEAIYFGAELEGSEIWGHVTERDDVIFRDNDFEIFIDTDSDSHTYCEFEMNALNTVWDLLLTKPYRDGGKPINGFDIKGMQTAVKVKGQVNNATADNQMWSVEVKMPFQTLIECNGQASSVPRPGEYWRINFSRVQWQVDIIDGKFNKRINPANNNPYPEDNWVWSPMGIINMHYPELWGFVFFCNGSEGYVIPDDEKRKWELRKMYYKQHAHFDQTGKFSTDIKADWSGLDTKIQITDNGFEISCPTSDGNSRLIIFTDGLTQRM